MPEAGLKLSRAALPQRDGYSFVLLSAAAAQAEADRSGRPVYFITVDQPSITDDTATISLGVDVVSPREPKTINMCCCTGQGQFRRTGGRWAFVKWAQMIIARDAVRARTPERIDRSQPRTEQRRAVRSPR